MELLIFRIFPLFMLLSSAILLFWWLRIFSHPSRAGETKASIAGGILSLVFLTWTIAATIFQKQIPVLNLGQLICLLGVLIWASQSYIQLKIRQKMLVLLPLSVVTSLFLFGVIIGTGSPAKIAGRLTGPTTGFHMALSMAGIAMLLGSGVFAVEQLTLHSQIKKRNFGRWFSYLPSLEELDRLRRHTLVAGWFIVTFSLLNALILMVIDRGGIPVVSHLHPMLTLWVLLTVFGLANRFGWLAINKLAVSSIVLSAVILVLLLVSLFEIFGKALA